MKRAAAILCAFFAAGLCFAQDDEATEKRLASAIDAADALAILGDYELDRIAIAGNRDFLSGLAEDGMTLREGHTTVKTGAERIVAGLGEVRGKYAEAALLAWELARLGSAELELALGYDPVDESFMKKAREYRKRVDETREKLKPLLPPGVILAGMHPCSS